GPPRARRGPAPDAGAQPAGSLHRAGLPARVHLARAARPLLFLPMDRDYFYSILNGSGEKDYEVYLNTARLLSCQKGFADFCNADELQFQVVHQSMELWMKLIGYTLLDVDDYLRQRNTNRVLTLLNRVHRVLHIMTA